MKRTIFPYDFSPYYPGGIQPCPMYVDVAIILYSFCLSSSWSGNTFQSR